MPRTASAMGGPPGSRVDLGDPVRPDGLEDVAVQYFDGGRVWAGRWQAHGRKYLRT